MKSTIPLTPVESSQIAAIGFDPATNQLAITFRQKHGTSLPYHYPCTQDFYEEFQKAESKGRFFNQRIRDNADMPATKMVADEQEDA